MRLNNARSESRVRRNVGVLSTFRQHGGEEKLCCSGRKRLLCSQGRNEALLLPGGCLLSLASSSATSNSCSGFDMAGVQEFGHDAGSPSSPRVAGGKNLTVGRAVI